MKVLRLFNSAAEKIVGFIDPEALLSAEISTKGMSTHCPEKMIFLRED